MFADYRIPQALVYFGAMEYTEELMKYLQKDHLLNSGEHKKKLATEFLRL